MFFKVFLLFIIIKYIGILVLCEIRLVYIKGILYIFLFGDVIEFGCLFVSLVGIFLNNCFKIDNFFFLGFFLFNRKFK